MSDPLGDGNGRAKVQTASGGISRRGVLKVLGGLGVGTAAFQRALAAQVQEAGAITPEMIQKSEWIAGLELTEEERERWRAGETILVEKDWFSVDLDPAIYHETATRPVSELARRLAQPALIIHGKRDETIPLAHVLDFVRDCAAPGLELLVIGDGDHRLTDHKNLLAKELIRFAGLD